MNTPIKTVKYHLFDPWDATEEREEEINALLVSVYPILDEERFRVGRHDSAIDYLEWESSMHGPQWGCVWGWSDYDEFVTFVMRYLQTRGISFSLLFSPDGVSCILMRGDEGAAVDVFGENPLSSAETPVEAITLALRKWVTG